MVLHLVDVTRHESAAGGGVKVDLEAERSFLSDGELTTLKLETQ